MEINLILHSSYNIQLLRAYHVLDCVPNLSCIMSCIIDLNPLT